MSVTRRYLLATLLLGQLVGGPVHALRFVVAGHIRDMPPNHVNILDALAESFANADPDYIFLLGDMTYDGQEEHWQIMDSWLAKLRQIAPVVSAPGNHDITQPPLWTRYPGAARDQYLSRFGYLYFHLRHEAADFVFVNSCDDLGLIVDYIDLALPPTTGDKTTILLSHFKLWDDVSLEERARFPDKSDRWYYLWNKRFDWAEILPSIQGRVDVMIAGDADYAGNQPLVIDGIEAYPIGIGSPGRNDPIAFFTGEIGTSGTLTMTRHEVEIPADDPWNTTKDDFEAIWSAQQPPPRKHPWSEHALAWILGRVRLRYTFLAAMAVAFGAGFLASRIAATRRHEIDRHRSG